MNIGLKHNIILFVTIMSCVACGDTEEHNHDDDKLTKNNTNKMDQSKDMVLVDMSKDIETRDDMEEDLPTFGDLGMDIGDERRALTIKEWPLHDKSAPSESVKTTENNGVFTVTIDATAGGRTEAKDNPFVYLDLDQGKQVDLTDLAALDDNTWELAFKRFAIRTNSGDSGNGKVSLALIENTEFDAVKTPPTDANQYVTDKTFDETNTVRVDPIGTPFTAFNDLNLANPTGSQSWYAYNMGVSPTPNAIYVLKDTSEGATYKFQILSWQSGVFEIKWTKF